MARIKEVHDKDMVAHLWAHRTQDHARVSQNNFSFNGGELRSYGTTIGMHFGEFVLLSRDSMSATTGGQLNCARSAASHLRRINSDVFRWGSRYSDRLPPRPEEILEDQHKHLERLLKELQTKRIASTKARCANEIRQTADDINFLRQHFKIRKGKPVVLPSDLTELIATSKAQVEALDKARQKAQERAEAQARKDSAAKLQKWLAGEPVYLDFALRYQSFDGVRSHLLTLRGDEVVTSDGATCPIKHARKALEFYFKKNWPWKKNGHRLPVGNFEIDWIDENGIVKAGCHTFHPKEIERFVKVWGAELFQVTEAAA